MRACRMAVRAKHTGKLRRIQACKARVVGMQGKNGSTLAFRL